MVTDYVYSLIRTAVPVIVGFVLSIPGVPWLISAFGVDSASAQRVLASATTFVLALAYYGTVRLLEQRWPRLGYLLGVAKAPTYDKPLVGNAEDGPDGSSGGSEPAASAAVTTTGAHSVTVTIPIGLEVPGLTVTVQADGSALGSSAPRGSVPAAAAICTSSGAAVAS